VRDVFEDATTYEKRSPDAPGDQQAERKINFTAPLTATNSTTSTNRYLADLQGAGKRGRVLHPRAVTQFIRGHGSTPSWRDCSRPPRAGTGGLPGLRHRALRKQYVKKRRARGELQESIRGHREKGPHAAPAVHDQHDPARDRGAIPTSATTKRLVRPYATRPQDRVDVIRHQSTLWRHGRERVENSFPQTFRTAKPPICSWCCLHDLA